MMKLIFAFITALLLAGVGAITAQAHCKGNHQPPHEHCDDPGGGGSGEISVQITLDDTDGYALQSDGGAYIDGADKVTANISALQFRMTPENRSTRTVTTDFGPTVDCSGATAGPGDCIVDAFSGQPIECPHGAGLTQCSGARTVYLFFRDVVIDENTTTTIHAMAPDGNQYLGQHWDPEIHIRAEKRQQNGWVLIFKDDAGLNACDGISEQLGITANDTDNDGNVDEWSITTDTIGMGGFATKIACLAKQGRNSRTFVGFVEMQFAYTIDRLN